MKRVLLFGGTGAVGSCLVRKLSEKKIPVCFTYFQNEKLACELADLDGIDSFRVDLSNPSSVHELFSSLEEQDKLPSIFIHSAAISGVTDTQKTSAEDWMYVQQVNVQSAFITCQLLFPHFKKRNDGQILLLGALDRTQSLPLPAAFAASQGALSALTMALAKEFGLHEIKINMLSLGLLEDGLSKQLDAQLHKDFLRFSSLQKKGAIDDVANAILWFALHNRYMSGKVLPMNGGI